MPDLFLQALDTPGLGWLILTISVAGIVRGFTGFGTALIFVPVANVFLAAADVIAVMTITGIASLLALVPRAVKTAELRDISILGGAAVFTVPLGLWLLTQLPHETIRWLVAIIAFSMLSALILGWRYTGKINIRRLMGIGGASGVIGGMTGLTGPVVILFYLAKGARAAIVRANTIIFLAILDVVIVANLLIGGMMDMRHVWLGGILGVPYFITSRIGQALFDPNYEKTYRTVAYLVIALAVMTGLPIWD